MTDAPVPIENQAAPPPHSSGVAAAVDGPHGEHGPDAITSVYRRLHDACGAIVQASLQAQYAQLIAESHAFLQELEHWAEVIAPNKEQHLLAVAVREYQYALLALAQGLYRQAFKGLRLVLELCLQAIHLSAHQVELQEWLTSRKDTVWGALVDENNGVLSVRFSNAFFPELKDDVRHHRGLAEQLYRECSECVHGNMQKHIPLPTSLIFSAESFELWHRKAAGVALVITFALSLRYLRDMTTEQLKTLEHDLLDRLGHVAAIRRRFGGPEGG
jgi:hypothetical protein